MSREAARRALIHAQLELENTDPEAISEAVRWTTRALTHLFDLDPGRSFFAPVTGTGSAPSCPGDSREAGEMPTGTTGSASGVALTAPNVRDVQGGR